MGGCCLTRQDVGQSPPLSVLESPPYLCASLNRSPGRQPHLGKSPGDMGVQPFCRCPRGLGRGTPVLRHLLFLLCPFCCRCSVPRSCRTLATPWTVACPAPLPMGFSRQEYWRGLPLSPSGDLPPPGMEPASPALAGVFFTTSATWKPVPILLCLKSLCSMVDSWATLKVLS